MAGITIVPDGKIGYGIQLPIQALSVRTALPWERDGGTIDDMLRVATACDDAGFLYIAVCHHVAVPSGPAEMMGTQWFDPVPTLAFLAARTTRTRLMTNVYVVAYQHPLQTAKAFATIDALSGGRVILGVGAGHVEGEFEALGVPFADRGRITDEAIDAIDAALRDEWPSHSGDRWKFGDVGQQPRPIQQPRPPIWIGGSGKPALRRVAARGDGWIPQGTPRKQLPADIDYIRTQRDQVRPGAQPEIGFITEYVHVGEPDWEIPKYSVSGSPERLIESFNELGAIGVSHLQLRFACRDAQEQCDQIAAFGAQVGPHLTRVALNQEFLMPLLTMRQDFRAPSFGPASTRDIYAAAIEQMKWADAQGWNFLVLSEHHAIDDGWMPAPLTIAAALLGATQNVPVLLSASIVPLHDPVRLAEQIAVIDNAFPGRLWTVFGAGYREEEFVMANADHARRGKVLEEYVGVMLQAWTGEPFEWQGRTIRVTPVPASKPRPTVLMGGGVPAAARRAARLRLPMLPMNTDQSVRDAYFDEAAKIGFTDGFVMHPEGPTFVHVTDDPDKAWSELAPHLLYETQTYASFQTPGQHSTPRVDAKSIDDLKGAAQIWVGTPDDIVERAQALPPTAALNFNPLAGGVPPDLAWASLELFAAAVRPRL